MSESNYPLEPYKIKSVEPIKKLNQKQREQALKDSGYNVFTIPSEKVYIDLLTDSGTSAMSDHQWAGIMTGDESYAGSRNYFHFQKTVRDVFGFKHVIPTHQGRAAERILFEVTTKKGDYVPNNIHFDTTRANLEFRGVVCDDLVQDSAYDPDKEALFKGDMDIKKLEQFISKKNPQNIPFVMITITNNSGGGQPVSLKNIKDVSRICRKHNIPLYLDACRFAENAYFIKKYESGYSGKSIPEIVNEIFSYADGATMSAKKDALVNIGGFVAVNDDELAEKLKYNLIRSEGFATYGGLAGRDLEAVSRGLKEVLEEDYLEHRIGQVRYLWECLNKQGVPVYSPPGGHAVYLLGDRFLPHIPRNQYPAWAVTVALYREAGIRTVGIGGVMFGKTDKKTGKEIFPELELVRLAIPRRVYTLSHFNFIAEAVIRTYQKRKHIKGFRMVHQAPYLRHFTAEMEEIP
ncbi:MAG: tryptophanase [Candidatus Aminicenantes bacterium]|nr:tryptophanase [Candidatus Aminicenantes bacterium]